MNKTGARILADHLQRVIGRRNVPRLHLAKVLPLLSRFVASVLVDLSHLLLLHELLIHGVNLVVSLYDARLVAHSFVHGRDFDPDAYIFGLKLHVFLECGFRSGNVFQFDFSATEPKHDDGILRFQLMRFHQTCRGLL